MGLHRTIEFVHIEQVSALFKFRLGQFLLYLHFCCLLASTVNLTKVLLSSVFYEIVNQFVYVGALCGLAIYNFTIIDLPFPLALYKKLLKEPVALQDLRGLSPTLAK
jgi:protein-S-isoprenylcysteine O-methyltransferase Ste14